MKKIESIYLFVKGMLIMRDYNLNCSNEKLEKLALKEMMKILKLKMTGKHPSEKEMITFVRKYSRILSYKIYREFEENKMFNEIASYYQYITLTLKSCYSDSSITISTLPYFEICSIFNISREEFIYNEIEEEIEDFEEIEN